MGLEVEEGTIPLPAEPALDWAATARETALSMDLAAAEFRGKVAVVEAVATLQEAVTEGAVL